MGRPKGVKNKEKMRWVSKDEKSTMVPESKLESYLNDGWIKGHATDTQKLSRKKWYNNGIKNLIVKDGDPIPNGFVPGQICNYKYSDYEYVWYTNGTEQKRISTKLGQRVPEGWYPGYCNAYKENMSKVLSSKGNFHLDSKNYTDEYKELYHSEDKLRLFVKEHHDLTLEDMTKQFNCSLGSIMSLLNTYKLQKEFDWYNEYAGTSKIEKQIVDLIRTFYDGEIVTNTRDILKPYELDIYIPDKKIAIEVNGTFWHSNNFNKNKKYHLSKSLECEKLGIRLIHIYEWEVQDKIQYSKIQMMLKEAFGLSNKIYARQCEIKQISNKDAKILNEKVHLQGHRNAQITYGLFYNNELVQLMSFSKTHYNKNLKNDNDWEIIRGCPGSNTTVIGGVSKLLKHFIDDYTPDNIFSYCDFNKFSGKSYEKCSMKFIGYTGPNKWILVGEKVINRNPKKYKDYKNYFTIWGAGSKKYLLALKEE